MEPIEILEYIIDKLKSNIISGISDSVYLQWASSIFLVLMIFLRECANEEIAKCLEESESILIETESILIGAESILCGIMAIILSALLINILNKRYPRYIERFSAYEEIDHHYYLKDRCLRFRHILSVLLAAWSFITIMAMVLKVFIDISKGDLENYFVIIEVCIILERLYLKGETYKEALKSFESSKPEQLPLQFWNKLTSDIMKNSIFLLKKINFPLKYGIRYPQNSYQERYSELFSSLMKDENIYLENIFYHDWGKAIIIPVNVMLLKGRKVVVFAGDSLEVNKIVSWLKKEMKGLLGIEKSWEVEVWEKTKSEYDICIVPYNKTGEFIQDKANFSSRGVFCLFLEPSKYITEMQFYMEDYADFLLKKEISPVYCFADRYIEGFIDYFSHVFRCKIKKIEIDLEKAKEVVLCVSDDGKEEELRRYWGDKDGNNNGIVAFNELTKENISSIVYVSDEIIPVKDMCINLKNKVNIVSQKALMDFDRAIGSTEFCRSVWGIERRKQQFIIAEDENCNFYELYWTLSNRGEDICNLFLLSGKYLLFDFMVDNASCLLNVKNAIPIFFPVYQDTNRNRILKLIRIASKKDMNANEVEIEKTELFQVFPEWENKELEVCKDQLNKMTNDYYEKELFGVDIESLLVFTNELKLLDELWKEVVMIDELKSKKITDGMLACHFYQKCLEEQYIAYGGRNYQIKEVKGNTQNLEVFLLRSQAHLQFPSFYYQRRFCDDFNIDLEADDCKIIKNNILIGHEKVSLTVETRGWYRRDGRSGEITEEKSLVNIPARKYRNKDVLFWRFSAAADIDEKFCCDLLELLEQIIRTVFPYHYQYMEFYHRYEDDYDEEYSEYKFYFIEDCEDDIGLVEAMEKNMEKLLEICYEYCKWRVEKLSKG